MTSELAEKAIDDLACKECGCFFSTEYPKEHTPFCDDCAHKKAEQYLRLITPRPLSEWTEADGEVIVWMHTPEGIAPTLCVPHTLNHMIKFPRDHRTRWTPLPCIMEKP